MHSSSCRHSRRGTRMVASSARLIVFSMPCPTGCLSFSAAVGACLYTPNPMTVPHWFISLLLPSVKIMSCGQCSSLKRLSKKFVSLAIFVCSACCRVTSVGSSICVHGVFNSSAAAFAKPAGGYGPCKLLVAVTMFLICLICGCWCCNSVAACAKAVCNVSYFTKRCSPAVFATIRNFTCDV